jgi:hypothetical protein
MDTIKKRSLSTFRGKSRKQYVLENNFHSQLKELIIETVLTSTQDNPIIRNVTAKDTFDTFIQKSEFIGDAFNEHELKTIESLDSKPYSKEKNRLRFSATEETDNRNKELVVIRKQNHYIAIFSVMKPVDVSDDQDIPEQEAKDDIFIKISRPISKDDEDGKLLYNFINVITKEYNI